MSSALPFFSPYPLLSKVCIKFVRGGKAMQASVVLMPLWSLCAVIVDFFCVWACTSPPVAFIHEGSVCLSMGSASSALTVSHWSLFSLSHFWALLRVWGYFGWSPRLLLAWDHLSDFLCPNASLLCLPSWLFKCLGWRAHLDAPNFLGFADFLWSDSQTYQGTIWIFFCPTIPLRLGHRSLCRDPLSLNCVFSTPRPHLIHGVFILSKQVIDW